MDASSSQMILRRLSVGVFAGALCVVASAHIGSPNVLFDGAAGPYAVRVIVRPPEVVPGLAEVTVRVDAPDVEHVVIRPVFWRAGSAGAPVAWTDRSVSTTVSSGSCRMAPTAST